MAVTNRRAGAASLAIDGTAYDVVGEATYSVQNVERETLKGQSGVQGFSEMPTQGFIGATIRDAGSLSVAAINAMTSVTVTLTLANGKIVYGEGMWSIGANEVNTQEGSFAVRFEGPAVYEETA